MENFGIFCLFVLSIGTLIGLIYYIIKYGMNPNHHDSSFWATTIASVDLIFIYYMFHHGLWMIIRGR